MGFQVVAGAVVIAGCVWAAQPVPATTSPVSVPGFNSTTAATAAPAPVHRDTLLPADCDGLLTGTVDMAALLGQPSGEVTSHAIVGIASPSVGQLERLTCTYTLTGRDDPALVLTVAGFTDPAAALAQRDPVPPDRRPAQQPGLDRLPVGVNPRLRSAVSVPRLHPQRHPCRVRAAPRNASASSASAWAGVRRSRANSNGVLGRADTATVGGGGHSGFNPAGAPQRRQSHSGGAWASAANTSEVS